MAICKFVPALEGRCCLELHKQMIPGKNHISGIDLAIQKVNLMKPIAALTALLNNLIHV